MRGPASDPSRKKNISDLREDDIDRERSRGSRPKVVKVGRDGSDRKRSKREDAEIHARKDKQSEGVGGLFQHKQVGLKAAAGVKNDLPETWKKEYMGPNGSKGLGILDKFGFGGETGFQYTRVGRH